MGRIVLPAAMIVYVTVSTDLVFAKTERRDIQTATMASNMGSTIIQFMIACNYAYSELFAFLFYIYMNITHYSFQKI